MIKLKIKFIKKRPLSIRKRILSVLLLSSLLAVLLTSLVAFESIYRARQSSLSAGNELIYQAAGSTQAALTERAQKSLEQTASDRAKHIDDRLGKIRSDVQILADLMTQIENNPEQYHSRSIYEPRYSDAGVVTAQLLYTSNLKNKLTPKIKRQIGIDANIQDFLVQLNENNDLIVSVYAASQNGYTIMADRFADRKFKNSKITPDYYESLSRPWYQEAVAAKHLIFTDVVHDALGGGPCIICAAPYYNGNNIAGVVGMGAFLDGIEKVILDTKIGNTGFSFLMNKDGYILVSPHKTGDLISDIDHPLDLKSSTNLSLAQAAKKMINGQAGITEVTINGKNYYLAYAPIKNANWYFATVIEINEVVAPARETRSNIINMAKTRIQSLDKQMQKTILVMAIAVVILLLLIAYIGWNLSTYLTRPIHQLSKGVQQIATGNLEGQLDIHTGDEIESLAISFNAMTKELKQHIAKLQQITAEKQRIATELHVATNIQQNMLPCIFPPYPERTDFDIFAAMYPAKEVGGDFYDFYLLDENHLLITIADVSDKGIPAAMFMVITKTILKNFSLSMSSPDDLAAVLQCANRQLCENNETMMFVTVFSGMLNLKTGKFIYVNAGHTPPLVRHKNNKNHQFEPIPVEKNCVLGIRDEFHFVQQELTLLPDDELFFYTDGVTDATDANGQRFSLQRLKETLNQIPDDASCKDILQNVKQSVKEFSQDTPQSDDLTMLAIKLKKINSK